MRKVSFLACLTGNAVMFQRCEGLLTQNHSISCVPHVLIYERILAGYWILSFLIIMLLLRGFHRCKNLSTERTITLLDSVGVIGYSILPRCLNYRVVKLHSGPEENSVRQMRKTGCQQCSSVDGGGGD